MTIVTPQGAVLVPQEIEAEGGAAIEAYVQQQQRQRAPH